MLGSVIAVIFHWWLGLILALSGAGIGVALIAGYIKTVTAAKYPNGRRNSEEN